MNRELFQKQYDFELEQRNSIASATNIPIVALTVLGGFLASVITGFKYGDGTTTYFFLILVVLSALSMLVSLYKVVRTFLGYSYQKTPPANQLKSHFQALKEWHLSNNSNEDEVEKDFNEYFDERLSEAAEHNSSNNIRRGNYLHDATAAVVVAFVFLFFASPFYIYQRVATEDKVHQVKLINVEIKEEEIVMAENDSGSSEQGQQQETPSAAPSETPSAAPKPAGPQNVIFKGNTDGSKTSATGKGSKSDS